MVTEIILIIIALLFLTIAIFLFSGKGKWLIAGYNALSEEERKKHDKKAIYKAAGFICVVCCVILCAVAYMGYRVDSGMMSETDLLTFAFILMAVLIASIIISGLYIGKKEKGNSKNEK